MSSRTLIHLGHAFLALLMSASGTRAAPPGTAEPAATAVFADIRWIGLCDNRSALEHAMSKRGARLQSLAGADPRGVPDRFMVQVDVRSAGGESGYAARVSISGEGGTRDVREVNAAKCEELHSAVAWVLVVLARSPRESDAKAETANRLTGPDPAPASVRADSAPLGAVPEALPRDAPAGSLLVRGGVLLKEQPRFAFGAELIGGWWHLRDTAWGPAVFFEHRPWRGRPLALRASLLTLASDTSIADSGIQITARRTAIGLGGSVKFRGLPLSLASGLEAGVLSARGSGAVLSHQSAQAWGAWLFGFRVEFPLFRDQLWVGSGADIVISPLIYAFQTTSERTIVESGPIELRTAARLKSRF